jgi:hypothetical protein
MNQGSRRISLMKKMEAKNLMILFLKDLRQEDLSKKTEDYSGNVKK